MQISQAVRVRGARWRIADIRTGDDCQVVTLAARSRDGLVEQTVLAPFDDIEPLAAARRPRFTSLRAWQRTMRRILAGDTPPGSLRSVHRARIEIIAHQLEPALAVVRGLGSRLLLADEVGLGKTIQAGIVLSELRLRGAADRALIVAPAGLRDQWCEELAGRFGLEAHLADAAAQRRLSATLPIGVNPWITESIVVTSVDFIKRPEILPSLLDAPWDVVVVDEAHAASSDSDRRSAVAALASRAGYVLLLTATPHSGDAGSFASLCRCGEAGDELLVFRRRRSEVRSAAPRKVHTVLVRTSAQELRLHALLERYVAAVRAERDGAWLAASVLHKRALSSASSLARSVERRLAVLAGPLDRPAGWQLPLPLAIADGECAEADDEPAWPAGIGLSDPQRETRLLRLVLAAARTAAARETKVTALARLLRRAREPAVVFTEYRDTLLHLRATLRMASAVLHGGLTRAERAGAIGEFVSGRRPLLLATDAGAEGLNLHRGCRLVVNLELPWNPMRLEQRIGRVDRIGQHRTVHAFHLVSAGTSERRILTRLRSRLARAAADIGAPDPLGGHEEQIIAGIVVLGLRPDAEDEHGTAEPGTREQGTREPGTREAENPEPGTGNREPGNLLIRPDLRNEAGRELVRLALARRLLDRRESAASRFTPDYAGAFIESDGPLVSRARRPAVRAALGGRALMLWRIGCEDGCGRPAESLLVPLMVEINRLPERWTWQAVDEIRRHVEPMLASALCADDDDPAAGSSEGGTPPIAREAARFVTRWHTQAQASARGFVSARLAREHAIQAFVPPVNPGAIQPGLFDRRAERAWVAAAAARAGAAAMRRRRAAALEHASGLSRLPPQLLLVLLPY